MGSSRTLRGIRTSRRSFVKALPAYDERTVVVRVRNGVRAGSVGRMRRMSSADLRDGESVLDSLVEQGHIVRAIPLYSELDQRSAFVASEPPSEPRSATVRALVCLQIAEQGNAVEIAELLNDRQDEFEYAYVPAIKRPFMGGTPAPFRSRQWGHAAVRVDEARALPQYHDGSNISVAIVDSGIDETHPDLSGAIDSYRNFLTSETDDDFLGHGTHVAGIVAATINNGIGISGICAARLAILKALPRPGSVWDPIAYYRALGAAIDIGARVVNLSLGGAFDRGEADIIEDMLDAGIVVVAAMGNEYERGNPISYPAANEGVIAVGAVDEADRRAAFSCTGQHIALVAPGVNVFSTVPQHPTALTAKTMYDTCDGKSMAAPYVSAAAALILGRNPGFSPAQVRDRLMQAADPISWPTIDPGSEYGAGRLNIFSSLQ